jgi:hypothetical protein
MAGVARSNARRNEPQEPITGTHEKGNAEKCKWSVVLSGSRRSKGYGGTSDRSFH